MLESLGATLKRNSASLNNVLQSLALCLFSRAYSTNLEYEWRNASSRKLYSKGHWHYDGCKRFLQWNRQKNANAFARCKRTLKMFTDIQSQRFTEIHKTLNARMTGFLAEVIQKKIQRKRKYRNSTQFKVLLEKQIGRSQLFCVCLPSRPTSQIRNPKRVYQRPQYRTCECVRLKITWQRSGTFLVSHNYQLFYPFWWGVTFQLNCNSFCDKTYCFLFMYDTSCKHNEIVEQTWHFGFCLHSSTTFQFFVFQFVYFPF